MRIGRILGWFVAVSLPFFGCNCGRSEPRGVPVASPDGVRGARIDETAAVGQASTAAAPPAAASGATASSPGIPASAPLASTAGRTGGPREPLPRKPRREFSTPEEEWSASPKPNLQATEAPAPKVPPAASTPPAPGKEGDARKVGAAAPEEPRKAVSTAPLDLTLADISYFDCSDENPKIPDKVLGWSGRRIAIKGFMMPIDYDEGVVREFMLVPYVPGCCCFGIPFKRNEIVKVKVADAEGCKYLSGALRVEGTLTVHRVSVRDDFIFTMAGAAVHGTE